MTIRKPLTEKTDDRILFSRIKNVAQTKPYRSAKFKAWLREQNPPGDFHHVCGSVHKLKSTDLLAVIVPHGEHIEGEDSIEWLMEQIPPAIENLMRYVEHLEAKIERLLEALGYEEVVIPEQPKKIVMRKKGKK